MTAFPPIGHHTRTRPAWVPFPGETWVPFHSESTAAIDAEHRTTAQVRIYLSPEAHLAASQQWRESLWVDLGIGFCGLSAYLPCDNLLACLPCPHFVATAEHLPLYGRQRDRLIELRLIGEPLLPPDRQRELAEAVEALDHRITALGGESALAPPTLVDGVESPRGEAHARVDGAARRGDRDGARRGT